MNACSRPKAFSGVTGAVCSWETLIGAALRDLGLFTDFLLSQRSPAPSPTYPPTTLSYTTTDPCLTH